jgi:phosphate:Na+ symporter
MTETLFGLAGGIGLLLLGMTLLTDGLKAIAGGSLRRALIRFTGSPTKAFASGTLATMLVQTSSATTVTMIGFVSAGLLTFPQALGVVLGACLGTTSTGWLVAVLGLKVSVGYYALPLVAVGAFLRLLASGRWKAAGLALAGFGLIFVGIDHLQVAMKDATGMVDFASLPATGIGNRLLIVVIGFALAVLMQSSSAAVATTLTALHTESISFDQAALVVIGASVGTTLTSVLAAIGASIPAKRTALALVLFTLGSGAATLVTLPVYLQVLNWVTGVLGMESGTLRLAAFHSSFVAIAIAMVLPFTKRFARRVEDLLPDSGPELTANLDSSLLQLPEVALEAVNRTLRASAAEMFSALRETLNGRPDEARVARVEQALRTTEEFFARIPAQAEHEAISALRASLLHGIDHLIRLEAYTHPPSTVTRMMRNESITRAVEEARSTLSRAEIGVRGDASNGWVREVERGTRHLADLSRDERPRLLRETASGNLPAQESLNALDTLRWLARVTFHVWRACHYLGNEEDTESVAEHESWRT